MNTKRMMRWLIVLFLLAALPGMTAVMAQGRRRRARRCRRNGTANRSWPQPGMYPRVSQTTPAETADPVQVNDRFGAKPTARVMSIISLSMHPLIPG
ncbi:MAG: hypothetical protein KIT52_06655 [Anaerolineae bacterium]|nr:hypothetical protein [Anaerolineae bacterium]